jgi:dolichol-phosphate mannosyltransferase
MLRSSLATDAELEFIFIDDGSKDRTFEILKELSYEKNYFKVASLSRNFGHQIAITAGIDIASGNYVAIIDGDLQDPPELIADMYYKALTGFDVVYGRRRSRAGETFFKKITALGFYRLLNYMCEMEIPKDTGDFRLMSRNAVNAFKSMRERHRFVRGMVPWLGFRAIAIEYDRDKRFAGTTKYPLRKMIAFASNAIFSFSSKPLTIAIRIGLATILIGFIGGAYILYMKIFTSIPVPGLTAVLLSIVIFSGVQILLIGIVGEYIARIFEEVKNRPLYIFSKTINF